MRRGASLLILFLFLLVLFPYSTLAVDEDERFTHLIHLKIEPLDAVVAEITPTQKHEFRFRFYNGGVFQTNLYLFHVEFSVEVEGKGWTAYVSPTWDKIFPGETGFGKVEVAASSRPSNYAFIHVTGRLRDIYGNWHYETITFQVKAAPYHAFDVQINKTFFHAKQEKIYSVPMKIVNHGNYEEIFTITTLYHPPNWRVALSQRSVILPPQGQTTVYVTFAIPHEQIFLQETTYFIMMKVKPSFSQSAKSVAIIVAVEGFHLTLGQMVAFLSSIPSLLVFVFVGLTIYSKNSLHGQLPKPWKEEKEQLTGISPIKKKRTMQDMKEEWKSARYFMKLTKKDHRRFTKLKNQQKTKQKQLEEKITTEWKKAWMPVYDVWKEECNKIKQTYNNQIKQIDEKIKKLRTKNISTDITLPKIQYPPEPKKPLLQEIPKYRLDEKRQILIEPDEIEIEKILMPVKKSKILAKKEIIKIKEMSKEIITRLTHSIDVIAERVNIEMKKNEDKLKKTEQIKKNNKNKKK